MAIEENKQVVLRFNREFLEGGNTAVLKELVDESFVRLKEGQYIDFWGSNDIMQTIQQV